MKKPRICEVLGVEVGERFELGNTGIVLLVNDDGLIHISLSHGHHKETDLNVNYLVKAINHPEQIVRKKEKALQDWTLGEVQQWCKDHNDCSKECPFEDVCDPFWTPPNTWELPEPTTTGKPQWTKEEVERAKAIKLLYPDANAISDRIDWTEVLKITDERTLSLGSYHGHLFPSAKMNKEYSFDEIIGGSKA